MKKLILCFLIALILILSVFSQNKDIIYGSETDGIVRITEQNISLNILDYQHNGNYKSKLETKSKINFIEYDGIKNIICLSSKLLYLINPSGCFYDGVGYNNNGRSGRYINFIGPAKKYTSSSFLTEKNKKYESANLASIKPDFPWAEGVKGDGIGEYIDMEWEYEINGIIIINGFISFDKPELFLYNNRVKAVKISIDDFPEKFIYELDDSSNPQIIQLNKHGKKIRLEIMDVYKGSQWDDTCVSMIVGISSIAGNIFFDP
jgi:hypothetical protein